MMYSPLLCFRCNAPLHHTQVLRKFGDQEHTTVTYPVWTSRQIGVKEWLVGGRGGSLLVVCCPVCRVEVGWDIYIHNNTREYRIDSLAQYKDIASKN